MEILVNFLMGRESYHNIIWPVMPFMVGFEELQEQLIKIYF